ncbi:cysteine protease ATG4D-like, partial [Pyrgilauda ruficollis]|uniref:cysteine protease ATG4D-like n=1 Tax=Pyrgilauda ruficollis TaxID=221976 RepID=UPI001B85F54D
MGHRDTRQQDTGRGLPGHRTASLAPSPEDLARFRRDFCSRLWLTYRSGFPALPGTPRTTDCGWGCTLRSAQMLLGQGLLLHLLGRDWVWPEALLELEPGGSRRSRDPQGRTRDPPGRTRPPRDGPRVPRDGRGSPRRTRDPLGWSQDPPGRSQDPPGWTRPPQNGQGPPRMDAGPPRMDTERSRGTRDPQGRARDPLERARDPSRQPRDPPGQPLDPSGQPQDPLERAQDPLERAWDPLGQPRDPSGQPRDPLAGWTRNAPGGRGTPRDGHGTPWNGHGTPRDSPGTPRDSPGTPWNGHLAFPGVTACPPRQELLQLRSCLGIIGGKPRHSLFFLGFQGDSLLYLDPHLCQPCVDTTRENFPLQSFHCCFPRKMSFGKMDPSCTFGFYARGTELEQLWGDLARVLAPPRYPIFTLAEGHAQDQALDAPPAPPP